MDFRSLAGIAAAALMIAVGLTLSMKAEENPSKKMPRIIYGFILVFSATVAVIVTAAISIHFEDECVALGNYSLMKNGDEYTSLTSRTYGGTRIVVSYVDDEGDVKFVDVKDADTRIPLKEDETEPYVEIVRYKWFFVVYDKELVHINL